MTKLSKEQNVLFAAMSSEYPGVSMLTTLHDSNMSLMFFVLVFIYIILTFAMVVLISNQLSSFYQTMGILRAMGVSKASIVFPYNIFFLFFAVGTALGVVAGSLLSEIFIGTLNESFNIVITRPPIDFLKSALFIVAVSACLTFFVVVYAFVKSSKKPLDLIYASDKQKVGAFSRGVKKIVSIFVFFRFGDI